MNHANDACTAARCILPPGGGSLLERLQLFTRGKAVDAGMIPAGHYGIPEADDTIRDLGPAIDALFLARRPKAMDMSGDTIVINYDPRSAEFHRIAELSLEKDSHCVYGPDFLIFERSTASYYDFYCGSKSTRGAAKHMYQYLPLTAAEIRRRGRTGIEPHGPLPATLTAKLVTKGTFTWHVPVIARSPTPFHNRPPLPEIVRHIDDFLSPARTNELQTAN